MSRNNLYEEYCTGCGLCYSHGQKELKIGENGFETIDMYQNPELGIFCEKTCPANGRHLVGKTDFMGKYIGAYKSYSCDKNVRYSAASGGATTAIGMYLLDEKIVDGVIHVGVDEKNPFGTRVYCSRTSEEVFKHCASKYITSSPLLDIVKYLKNDTERYAFIGRPCDVVTLRNYLEWNPEYKNKIYCMIAFFCAGAPSVNASMDLIERLGVDQKYVSSIRYRGNGWPGKVTVTDIDGNVHTMEYIDSWNNILGRNIRKICKVCGDGVGEAADIANGDLWLLDENKKPKFEEKDGLNISFTRTERGEKIMRDAQNAGYIYLQDYKNEVDTLKYIQPNHAIRKKTLYPRILALITVGRQVPMYDKKVLREYAKENGIIVNCRTYLGTIKRIIQGKI